MRTVPRSQALDNDDKPASRHHPLRWLCAALAVASLSGAGVVMSNNPTAAAWATQELQGVAAKATQAFHQADGWVNDRLGPQGGPGAPQGGSTVAGGPSGAANTPAPTPSPARITLVIPTPTAATVSIAPVWAPADCDWAKQILAWDRQLDAQEAAAVASGQDTRYGSGPALVAYYQDYANKWGTVLGEVAAACAAPPTFPTATQRDDAVGWFDTAIAAHQSDLAKNMDDGQPNSAGQWDQAWTGYYRRLIAMFGQLPG